jgi:hypothetical protein
VGEKILPHFFILKTSRVVTYHRKETRMSENLRLHLHMFDGGAGASAGAGAEGAGSDGGEAQQVVYGKADEDTSQSQSGTDGGEEDNSSEEDEGEDLGAEFEELISGRFKDQFSDRVSGIIKNRFKNAQNYEQQVRGWQDATAMLAAKYGIDGTNPDALKKAIESDDGIFSDDADAEGMTAEQYRENLRLKLDADRGRSLQQEMQREAAKRQQFAQWDAEADALKEAFPQFNLSKELDNDVFTDSLNRGNDVRTSFFIAHMDDILSGSMEAAQQAATQQTVKNFKSRAARPSENGLAHQPATVRKDDPSKLTDKELFEVAERARRGEKIRF